MQINKIKIHLILALIFHIIFQCHDIAFAKHLPKIAPPYVDPDLTEFHHKKQEYKNILGYLQDEYLLLYGNHETWLFDMNGKQYREWNTNIKRAELLPNCNLMVIDNNQHKYISEKNTAGEAVWTHYLNGRAHHDFELSED